MTSERLEGTIHVGARTYEGAEASRRVAFEKFTQGRLERAYRLLVIGGDQSVVPPAVPVWHVTALP
jgi:hypothetical protein